MSFVSVSERVTFRPEKMTKSNLFEVHQLFLDVYGLEPGQEQKPHTHGDAAKVYYVLEGEATFTVGEEVRALGPGYAVLAAAGELHGVRNESAARVTLLMMMAPNPNA
jgi:quercetin dioxygenase-like cupin family protein